MAGLAAKARLRAFVARADRPDVAGYVAVAFDHDGRVIATDADLRAVPNRARAISEARPAVQGLIDQEDAPAS